MENAQEDLSQDNAPEIVDAEGSAEGVADEVASEAANKDDPYGVKKRLGMQAKKHSREVRALQEQLAHVHNRLDQQQSNEGQSSFYQPQTQDMGMGLTEEQRIQKAVHLALQAREAQEAKSREAEKMAHVHKSYQRLQDELDKGSDKYEDFDDIVRGDAPFTTAIRDSLLFVDNPADVAYKLGKNLDELQRISQLHPLDQAREVNKLSFALLGGNIGKPSSTTQRPNPMGQSRPNPVNTSAITDKTPVSDIRARMKAGTWK
jgi:hypothetical protein